MTVFRFDPFEFDPAAGLVYRGDEETLLPPKAAHVLQLLLESAGQLVSKDELLETIWEDAYVTESSLTDAISLLRRVLGDDTRDPTYIQTLHRRGYRFIGAVEEQAAPAPDAESEATPSVEPRVPQEGGLKVGERLGSYEILCILGAGAMGTVYRARDTTLERDVAIKLLRGDFAGDPERLGRLEREAKLLAAVSHPNIAAIYSLEEANGIKFPVLELVEGETLDQRLRSDRIKVDEALELARQIASALEAAHEQGIIHRDLKPANIKLTPTGQVKVLDFGLAKALEVHVFGADVSDSPTESVTIMGTRRGSIVGTAAYMSPEQAKGQEADRRADIWSFGCVLYEMLTGRRPFKGDTVSDTIAGVLEREPDWDALPNETPRAARRILRRCLSKDPDRRLHDIADARIELEEAMAEPPGEAASEATTATPAWRFALPWALTATVVIAALWLGWGSLTAPQRPMNRLAIPIPLGTTNFAVSPNGQDLVFQATAGGLYHRPLGERAARSIAGAERGSRPVFSPDGRSILFFADGELKQVPLAGGEANSLADVSFSDWAGLFWGPSGDIVLAKVGDSPGLWSLPAAGGTLTPIPEFALESDPYFFPTLIPGSHVMLASRPNSETLPQRDRKIVALDLDTGTETDLGVRGLTPRYSPSGHLVFARYDGGGEHQVAGRRVARR